MAIDLEKGEWTLRGLAARITELEEERDRLAERVRQLVAQARIDRQAIEKLRGIPINPGYE